MLAASSAGFDNNCSFIHGALAEAIDALPEHPHYRSLVVEGLGHVVTPLECAHQEAVQQWLDSVLATKPPWPWP